MKYIFSLLKCFFVKSLSLLLLFFYTCNWIFILYYYHLNYYCNCNANNNSIHADEAKLISILIGKASSGPITNLPRHFYFFNDIINDIFSIVAFHFSFRNQNDPMIQNRESDKLNIIRGNKVTTIHSSNCFGSFHDG